MMGATATGLAPGEAIQEFTNAGARFTKRYFKFYLKIIVTFL